MRVLVTGATGFVGKATSLHLRERGHHVVATGRNASRGEALASYGVTFRAAELTDTVAVRALCRDIDVVVHCAAHTAPWGSRSAFVRANVDATRTLVAACSASRISRLVHLSTPSIYMGFGDREGVREDDPLPPPRHPYAESKLEAERIVLAAASGALPSVILRPRAIFGPGDTTIFPRLLRALERGRLPIIGSGENLVDLTYIDNVTAAIELALTVPEPALGRAYNISNGEPVRLWYFLGRLCDALQLERPRRRVSRAVASALARALEGMHTVFMKTTEPWLTRYAVEVLARTMTLDITRARRELGYEPQVTLDEGLARFVSWWREQS